jgi:predicted MPP superfamily phosphohydrolase
MSLWPGMWQKLDIGSRRPLLVRRETLSGFRLNKRILFASDLHLRRGGPARLLEGLRGIVSRERPDLVLLGGDLVDWAGGVEPLKDLVRDIRRTAPVAAVGGNHDRWAGLARVKEAVLSGGGDWLEDRPLRWTDSAAVYGSPDQPRLSGSYHILCAHHPPHPAARADFHLTLSGHLHGGQVVFYEREGQLFPGAFAYRWNGLRFHEGANVLLVSRGAHDTLPLRWNCPREVLLVDL